METKEDTLPRHPPSASLHLGGARHSVRAAHRKMRRAEDSDKLRAGCPPYPDFEMIRPSLTDDEIAGYYDRTKIYGQVEAMKWVVQQHPPGNP